MAAAAETLERQTQAQEQNHHQDGNLYGVDLYLQGYWPEEVSGYIYDQEATHVVEGLALMQRSVKTLDFKNEKVRGFAGKPMVDIARDGYLLAKKQYLQGDRAAEGLMRRRKYDITIAEVNDELMTNGEVGDGFMVVSPYGEEWDKATAERMGQWPAYRRAYIWLFRKKSSSELERVDISIDQSSLATFRRLLLEYGVEVPNTSDSHDLAAHGVWFKDLNESARNELINELLEKYAQLNDDVSAKNASNAFEASTFIEQYGKHYLRLATDVHKSIATSLERGYLDPLARSSAQIAVKTLNCLSREEKNLLHDLLGSDLISDRHRQAFATLISAQRYGIWETMARIIEQRSPEELSKSWPALHNVSYVPETILFEEIYANTNRAASAHETMPGCSGGTSFLKQDESDIKSSIFSAEKYSFDKKMFCVVCQAPPKKEDKPKRCGPCGICKSCDGKLKKAEPKLVLAA